MTSHRDPLAVLDAMALEHRTAPAAAIDWTFEVRTNDAALGAALAAVLQPLTAEVTPSGTYSVVRTTHAGLARYRLYRDALRLLDCDEAARTFHHLLWDVNQQAFRRSTRTMVLHAAAATWHGGALLLPGESGSGKTTLVAGLVERGMGYLTDEAVSFEPGTALVRPFPKALSLKPGARRLFSRARPTVPTELDAHDRPWHVVPDAIRPGAVAATAPVRWIVLPRYADGATTTLEPMPRAACLAALAGHAVSALDRDRFAALREVVRGASCHRLVVADLDDACQLVLERVVS